MRRTALSLAALALGAGGVLASAASFEPAATLKAADVAPPAPPKGPKHTLAPAAKSDGFLWAST